MFTEFERLASQVTIRGKIGSDRIIHNLFESPFGMLPLDSLQAIRHIVI